MNRFPLHILTAAALASLAIACGRSRTISESIDDSHADSARYSYHVSIDATSLTGTIPNVVSNINVWDMGKTFINPRPGQNNIFDFVEYVQLMTATGGNPGRDLFRDPEDRGILDDYDFSRLIANCRGILSLGAKPHLKLGNVPMKLSREYSAGAFGVNVLAPEDYGQYYAYIRALIQALCDEFGRKEMLCWHYGVFTEYENADWFQGLDGSPESAAEEFCKIYDWTVQALIDVLGQDGLYVGAHSMTVTEGLWDERLFIRHCAGGTNWANGGRGSHIAYLSASFYDVEPGRFTSGLDLPHTILHLRKAAEDCGLRGLAYGIDEGRILYAGAGSVARDLPSRTTGYTYMAAYDARLYAQLIASGGSYLSSWQYLSGDLFKGNPSVSYHVATGMARLAGRSKAQVSIQKDDDTQKGEVGALAGVDSLSGRTLVMLYNFLNDTAAQDSVDIRLDIQTPLKSGLKDISIRKVNDDCNWFDDWMRDRKLLGITDQMSTWSPYDACSVAKHLSDSTSRARYEELEATTYAECSRLVPKTGKVRISGDGTVALRCRLGSGNVWFIEIG